MKHKVFVQSNEFKDTKVLEIAVNSTYDQLLSSCLALLPEGLNKADYHLFIEDEDDEQKVKELNGVPLGCKLHLNRLKAIEVKVFYAGKDVIRTFRPNSTIQRIKKWATREHGISPADSVDFELQITGSNERPDIDTHLGALVQFPEKSICFDLVPSTRVNG